ncbi:MAG: YdbH domain-containing protein [Desulfobacter sp.]|nr:MAG: YdbH domain-containing protein [Desulfobacter sp.]
MWFKPIIKYLVLVLVLAIVGIEALIIGLPVIAESLIKKKMHEQISQLDLDFKIQRIGLTRTLVTNLRFGNGFSADLLEIKYEFKGLNSFLIKSTQVSGSTIKIDLEDSNQVRFDQFVFPPPKPEPSQNNGGINGLNRAELAKFLNFIPEKVQIKQSKVTICRKKQSLDIPFDILAQIQAKEGRAEARISIRPLGQTFDLILEGEMQKGITLFDLSARQINPGCLLGLVPDIKNRIRIKGPVDIDLKKKGQGAWAFEVSGLGAKMKDFPWVMLEKVKGQMNPASDLDPMGIQANGNLSVQADGLSQTRFQFNMNSDSKAVEFHLDNYDMRSLSLDPQEANSILARIKSFEHFEISNPRIGVAISGTKTNQTCKINLGGDGLVLESGPKKFNSGPVVVSTDIKGKFLDTDQEKKICFHSEFKGLGLEAGRQKINLKTAKAKGCLNILGASSQDFPINTGQMRFEAEGIEFPTKDFNLTCQKIKLKADFKPDSSPLVIDLDTVVTGIGGENSSARFRLKNNRIKGKITLDSKLNPTADLDLRLNQASLILADQKIEAKKIDLHLPLGFPFKPGIEPGRLRVQQIQYDQKIKANFSAKVSQTGDMGIILAGRIQGLDPWPIDMSVDLDAGLDSKLIPWAQINFKSDHFQVTQNHMAAMMPENKFLGDFQVDTSLDLKISLKNSRIDTYANLSIHDGSLDFPDLDFTAQGISGQIIFNDLLVAETIPGQTLFVETVNAGQFKFNNAALRFSIEDGKSVNIENLNLIWCNGIVSTESIRLPSPDDKLSLTLYCDRLEMDSLLQQIGAFDAKGGGTLNGRIPVIYQNGNISFNNGFLFSTPGQGGRVFVKDLDRMMKGFPRDTPEFSQLDLAGEALKDFEYDWAKLRMNTHKDTLNVHMELDGRPAKVLPFEYRKDLNSFMRVDATSPGSKFQGVKLDVNLKLPFNRVMKFGNKLKTIMD